MKTKWKGALIGAIVGFLIPWGLLIYGVIKGVPELGFALQPIIILSILILFVGLLVGYTINLKNKLIRNLTLTGFFAIWIYFLFKYLDYIKLPSIEQRGLSSLFFSILLISLVLLVVGLILGKIANKNEK